MTIQRYLPESRFSEATVTGALIFLSGQVPTNIHGDIREQTENILTQIEHILANLGSDKAHLVDATIYIKDFSDYDIMNEVWESWLPQGTAPCRACVQAHLAKPEWRLEIKVIATKI